MRSITSTDNTNHSNGVILKPHVRHQRIYSIGTSGLCWSPWLLPYNVLSNAQNAGSAGKRTRIGVHRSNSSIQNGRPSYTGTYVRTKCTSQNSSRARNTLLKSNVTRPDHVVRCRGFQECGSRFVNFACKFHRRWHRLRITLKSTTLLFMRSSNVWTTKPWQRS